ncbi:type II secretion system protein, partial [bacterium]|nr:type II secretion system protein [bacterium]
MKKAFTLAEVLITLAIIGVVAAMTIPTLIGNYKKLVVEVRLAKFYNNMNHALKLSTLDNGALESWDAVV